MSRKKNATKYQIFAAVDPTVTLIIPDLAKEIGLNESIVLMQIAFWIKTSNNLVDGVYWTYQTMAEMKEKAFPYWSVDTIRRIVHNLEDAGYILIGQHNKRKGDNTQWYALEPNALSVLKSIIITPLETTGNADPYSQVARGYSQVATPPLQDRTTLPEIPTETTQNKTIAPDSAKVTSPEKTKATPSTSMNPMKDAIAAAFEYDWSKMTGTEKGLVQKAAKELCDAGITPADVPSLYAYCKRQFTKFKPLALSGNATEWRKEQAKLEKKIVPLTTDLAQWHSPDPFDFLKSEGA